MNDTAATGDQEHPAIRHGLEARVHDRDPDRRTSSGPADISSAKTGRTYDRSRPNLSERQKKRLPTGAVHIWRINPFEDMWLAFTATIRRLPFPGPSPRFRHSSRQHLAALSGQNPGDISQGALTNQLRRLRLHGIIERIANSFRYQITTFRFRAALFFTRAYNRLLRPAVACALPDHHATDGPLKRAFDKIETALAAWFCQEKLAT